MIMIFSIFKNTNINLGNNILNQLKDILKCEQKLNKAKKLIELSVFLKEMKKSKYKNHLFSHKQEKYIFLTFTSLLCTFTVIVISLVLSEFS